MQFQDYLLASNVCWECVRDGVGAKLQKLLFNRWRYLYCSREGNPPKHSVLIKEMGGVTNRSAPPTKDGMVYYSDYLFFQCISIRILRRLFLFSFLLVFLYFSSFRLLCSRPINSRNRAMYSCFLGLLFFILFFFCFLRACWNRRASSQAPRYSLHSAAPSPSRKTVVWRVVDILLIFEIPNKK